MGDRIFWDLDDDAHGNVQHITQHGLSKEEVEDVLLNPENKTRRSAKSGRPATFGWTSTGRHIIVIWDQVEEDGMYPVTAYEVPPRMRCKDG